MSTSVRTTRLAAVGASAALAAGTVLVAAPAAPAKPASVKTSYTCTTEALGEQTMAVTVRTDLPAKVRKGKKVAARPVRMRVVLPESLVTPMRDLLGITAISGTATKMRLGVGPKRVPLVKVRIPETDVPASGSMALRVRGKSKAFRAPAKPGKYRVVVPRSFSFNAVTQDGTALPTFPCAVSDDAPTRLGTLRVTR